MINVTIIADSVNPDGIRLTTMLCKYPRYIHSEFMTHRVFSRNAASSRAIPFKKMVKLIQDEPAFPEKWGAEQKGMQSGDELPAPNRSSCKEEWLDAMYEAIARAEVLHSIGLHKSICNRLLEPFMHITTLVTATEWENFFKLRCHPDAEPTFQALVCMMKQEYSLNTPIGLDWGEWHMPFWGEMENIDVLDQVKIATARCARLSYLTHDGEFSVEKDLELYERLKNSGHWSPFEHCARATVLTKYQRHTSNFHPTWLQYRKTFLGEDGKS